METLFVMKLGMLSSAGNEYKKVAGNETRCVFWPYANFWHNAFSWPCAILWHHTLLQLWSGLWRQFFRLDPYVILHQFHFGMLE
jgi:hypothetical protein